MTTSLRTSGVPSAISMASRERHWRVTKAALKKTSPAQHDPCCINLAGLHEVHGTIVSIDGVDVIVDVQRGSVHRHNVRNVLTYSGGNAEASFSTLVEGQPIYYDVSSTMPGNCFLSCSPLKIDASANTLFGFAVLDADEVAASFPKAGGSGATVGCAVMQV